MERFYYTFWFPKDPDIAREAARKTPGITIDREKSGSIGLQLEAESLKAQGDFYDKVRELRQQQKEPV